MRRAELIELLQNDQWNTNTPPQGGPTGALQCWELNQPTWPTRPPPPPPGQSCASATQTWEPINDRLGPELEEAPLTKRQL